MKTALAWKRALEYLGGSEEKIAVLKEATTSPSWNKRAFYAALLSPSLRGIWWGLLVFLILLFSGQTSKFIYIDF